jgi:hypothetical protein
VDGRTEAVDGHVKPMSGDGIPQLTVEERTSKRTRRQGVNHMREEAISHNETKFMSIHLHQNRFLVQAQRPRAHRYTHAAHCAQPKPKKIQQQKQIKTTMRWTTEVLVPVSERERT